MDRSVTTGEYEKLKEKKKPNTRFSALEITLEKLFDCRGLIDCVGFVMNRLKVTGHVPASRTPLVKCHVFTAKGLNEITV